MVFFENMSKTTYTFFLQIGIFPVMKTNEQFFIISDLYGYNRRGSHRLLLYYSVGGTSAYGRGLSSDQSAKADKSKDSIRSQ